MYYMLIHSLVSESAEQFLFYSIPSISFCLFLLFAYWFQTFYIAFHKHNYPSEMGDQYIYTYLMNLIFHSTILILMINAILPHTSSSALLNFLFVAEMDRL